MRLVINWKGVTMKKSIYTLLIAGLTLSTAQAWDDGENYTRRGPVFKTQTATYLKQKDKNYNVRHSLLGKTLSAATVEHITPTDAFHTSSAVLHLNYFENYGESSDESFYVTPNRTKLNEQSQDFNGLEQNPWASIVVRSSSRAMEILIFLKMGKKTKPSMLRQLRMP